MISIFILGARTLSAVLSKRKPPCAKKSLEKLKKSISKINIFRYSQQEALTRSLILKKLIFLTLTLFLSLSTFARHPYYPEKYQQLFYQGALYDEELKGILFHILSAPHQINEKGTDSLSCSDKKKACYGHLDLGYRGARRVLFGQLHLKQSDSGYYIRDVYCHNIMTKNDGVGYNQIPNHEKINCEHTWPQSRFSRRFAESQQKSDLHHLYPTDSRANSVRGHAEFADLKYGTTVKNCDASRTEGGGGKYEPPTEHKGNVARAIFYFSVRYQMKISKEEEATLRSWHIIDPVDAEEMERNEKIYQVQHNRNPFIDWPELVDYVGNF